MKRQIFWLIFSCLSATSFLSHSMLEGDSPFKEQSNISSEKKEDSALPGTATNSTEANAGQTPQIKYPALENSAENTEKKADEKEKEADKDTQKENRGIIPYLCDELKIINRKNFKKYLGAQAASSIDVIMGDEKFESFLKDAFNDLYKIVDQKQSQLLLLKFQEKYFPEVVRESIEDVKLSVMFFMALEKATEYAVKNAIESQDKDSLWNDEMALSILQFLSANTPIWSAWAVEQYLKLFPLTKDNLLTSSEKESSAKISEEAKANIQAELEEINKTLELRLLEACQLIKSQETYNDTLALDLMQANTRLGQASSSPGMHRIQGGILGAGILFTLYMLSRTVCLPCVEHFEPEWPVYSALLTFIGVMATWLCFQYVHSSKSVPMLAGKVASDAIATAAKTKIKCDDISETLKTLVEPKNPWFAFEDSITKEQTNLLNGDTKEMIFGVFKKDPEQINKFLLFYLKYTRYRDFKLFGNLKEKDQLINFGEFVVNVLNEEQRKLFVKAIESLKHQIVAKKN